MNTYYRFSAERQLFFYVNIKGQQRLVKFGERNAFGASVFQTQLRDTAEAIRHHSLYKRGVIREEAREEPAETAPLEEQRARRQEPEEEQQTAKQEELQARRQEPEEEQQTAKQEELQARRQEPEEEEARDENREMIRARNFTQAKSLLSKRLGIPYGDIKTPDQLLGLAEKAGVGIVYDK